jgi:hypothetical protein
MVRRRGRVWRRRQRTAAAPVRIGSEEDCERRYTEPLVAHWRAVNAAVAGFASASTSLDVAHHFTIGGWA